MPTELRHLRSFVAVAEELSFRRAAERLHLCQPPLSRQIKALEDELGVRLLERGRAKRVTLTEAGQSYLIDARRLLSALGGARERAREASKGARGSLRIADVPELSTPVLAPLLQAFHAAAPRVKVSLVELIQREQLKALDEGRIHAAIYPNFGQPLSSRFQSQLLFSCAIVVVLPPKHPLAKRNKATLDIHRLKEETLLVLTRESRPGHGETLDAVCTAAHFTPAATQSVDKIENLLALVAGGYGVTILSETTLWASSPDCSIRLLAPPAPPFRLELVWLRDAKSPLLHNFLAVAKGWTNEAAARSVHPEGSMKLATPL